MRVIIQRVSQASLKIEGQLAGKIGPGLVVLAGFRDEDTVAESEWIAKRVLGLRVFPDEEGNLNRALEDIKGGLVAVPNFTLYGDCRKGRRPSFTEAARPEHAAPLYEYFTDYLQASGLLVIRGKFGSHMHVELVNDGPVTLIIEKDAAQ
ncbi:MAG: D-aminoacyl-tRNA deacylase [Candidatus Zipacnadales bacterium]